MRLAFNSSIRTKEQRERERNKACSIEGTLQRVNYQQKTLRLVAEGGVWEFSADSGSRMWFDDEPAILRCFHPLDHVEIVFVENDSMNIIKAIYAREKQLV